MGLKAEIRRLSTELFEECFGETYDVIENRVQVDASKLCERFNAAVRVTMQFIGHRVLFRWNINGRLMILEHVARMPEERWHRNWLAQKLQNQKDMMDFFASKS